MEGKARILVFGFSAEEEARIDAGLAALGVPAPLKLRPGHGGRTLRDILADGRQGTGGLESGERLVLFHNVTDAGVQALMRFFRGAGAGRPIFAVVTPTSIEWTLAELLAHLVAERAELEKGR